MAAAMPMLSEVGRHPTRKVEVPMIRMVTRKVYFRPAMSPSRPNSSAPSGCTRKPMAKARMAKMLRVDSGKSPKKFVAMVSSSAP
jgi:hypothetical protein